MSVRKDSRFSVPYEVVSMKIQKRQSHVDVNNVRVTEQDADAIKVTQVQ